MIFARLEVDGFKACGVFANKNDASDSLVKAAKFSDLSSRLSDCLYIFKPFEEMTVQDDLDCYPLRIGHVIKY